MIFWGTTTKSIKKVVVLSTAILLAKISQLFFLNNWLTRWYTKKYHNNSIIV